MQAEDDNAGGESNEVGNESDNSNTTGTDNRVLTMTQRMQKNMEVWQAHLKLLVERHPSAKLLHAGVNFPCMISSLEEEQCQHVGNHEQEESVTNYDCWLPAEVWNLLGAPSFLHSSRVPTKI